VSTKLHEDVQRYFIRRVKRDVEKSLPTKTERILRVEMSPMQQQYYKWVLSRNVKQLNKGSAANKNSLLNVLVEV